MKASIITIGDEILIGQIVDTNSAWIADKLNETGVQVTEVRSISDDKEQIVSTINELLKVSDFIFMTGGLGPTNDDITKKVLCEMLDSKLILNEDALSNLKSLLGARGYEVNENNYNQAMVPDKAEIFINKLGTAPGMMFRFDKKLLFSMPGVPFEMKYLMEEKYIPFLKNHFSFREIYHKTVLTSGIPEALLAKQLSAWESSLPDEVKLAYLPSPGYIRLRFSSYNSNEEIIESIDKKVLELKELIGNSFKSDNGLKPNEILAKLFIDKGLTLSTAESCTGGRIASVITSRAGSSAYFKGSVVAYSNNVKANVLGVKLDDIEKYGAVSSQVVEQMADGVKRLLKTDYAISVSGVAGPDGGTDEKPVGTVWIGMATPQKTISKKFRFYNDREINIVRTVNTAFLMLIDELKI